MKAEIRDYQRINDENFSSYEPDKQVFGYTLLFSIGVRGKEGIDYFEVDVASAGYLEQHNVKAGFLRHTILATNYNIPEALALMTKYVDSLEEESWEKLANKISRISRWEFEDYRPSP